MGLIGFGPAWDLGRAIAGATRRATRDRYATVTRRDPDGVTWGTIAGASGEVPLGGSLADAEVGDVVAVDWRGGVPVASGNATSPAVGARRVEGAVAPVRAASVAAHGAARAARSVADAAQRVAEAVGQHFFADTSGIHVTAATQDEWETSHSGANVLLNSAGQLFRDGLNNLLTLTTEGNARALTVWDGLGNAAGNVRAIIGEVITLGNAADGSVVTIDSDSMDMMHGTTEMLHFGYGEGAAASGTANAPYYTIGRRAVNSTVGNYSVAEGDSTTASGYASHAEGRGTTASRYQSHAEGVYTEASGTASHAEGDSTTASGYASHAEGSGNQTYKVVASGWGSHAEGDATYGDVTASARAAHAEGSATTASGTASHAEGTQTTASGANSHAEGQATTASGINSHAEGFNTIAASYNQTALGRYNVADANSTYALIIGNGTSDSARSNALTVGWDGTVDIGPTTVTGEDGGLKVHGSNLSTASQTASENLYALIAGSFDKGGSFRSYLRHVDLADGRQGVQVETCRSVNGANVYNGIQMVIDPSGNRAVVLSDRAAWLSALGYVAPTALPLASGCVAYSSGQTPTYSRDGHVVSVWGMVKPTAEVAAGGTLTIGTLPAGYRPSHEVIVLCQGSGQNKWALNVSTSGVLTASRYGSGATQAAMTTSVWLPFCATFITTTL